MEPFLRSTRKDLFSIHAMSQKYLKHVFFLFDGLLTPSVTGTRSMNIGISKSFLCIEMLIYKKR